MMFTVYRVRHRVSGKTYIGSTSTQLRHRWNKHVCSSRRRPDQGIHFAIQQEGAQVFEVDVLDTAASRAEMLSLEKSWILRLDTLEPHGYNLRLGTNHTDETKQKIGSKNRGLVRSAEHVAEMSRIRKGRSKPPRTPEHIERNAAANRGRSHTAAARQHMREAALQRWRSA